jgi:hypothetical protein
MVFGVASPRTSDLNLGSSQIQRFNAVSVLESADELIEKSVKKQIRWEWLVGLRPIKQLRARVFMLV